jgi:hypothetical protein
MVEFTKSFVAGFKYNDLTPHISWGKQFVAWAKLDSSPDEDVRTFATKLKSQVLRQKAIELVRSHTVPG